MLHFTENTRVFPKSDKILKKTNLLPIKYDGLETNKHEQRIKKPLPQAPELSKPNSQSREKRRKTSAWGKASKCVSLLSPCIDIVIVWCEYERV